MLPEDYAMLAEFAAKKFGKNPPVSGYRVRRDIRVLSVTERQKLFRALNVLYKDRGETSGGPYWDYTMDYYLPLPSDSVMWSSCFVGNGNGSVRDGPFRFMYGGFNSLIGRDIARNGTCPPRLINKDDIDQLMRFCYFANITTGDTPNYYQQENNLDILHDGVHDWVGGDMSHVAFAAYDPLFLMHHAFIDYIWEQFRRQQSSFRCRVDVEKDYRQPGDYAVDDALGLAFWEEMHGFEYLQNRDGLWRNLTTAVYGYELAPRCPECGNSENLYCDREIDPRRPEGVCVTKTKFFCVDPPLTDLDRGKPFKEPLGDGATVIPGTIHKGLPGDGRTRFMSQEEGLAILRQQIGFASPSPQSVTYDLKTPVSYKPTLTMDLLENVYVVSSADSRDALRREQSVIWSLLTSISVFIIRLL